ncbi:ornithine cyclodeaminase family protein [Streptomyces abyssomicinicus]|uniref:ornithine cyclodeaminase family protein n=1 Tax=Streptomyces abyssomicinicus TaxID=574929 RepID=UPI0012503C6A|nr:ornithine cyclodeaminase family protein [Streptomyces abyssomicinicus]
MRSFPLHTADRIRAAVGLADLVEPVADAFVAFSTHAEARAPVMVLPVADGGDSHVKAAHLPGGRHFLVKIANWFPGNRRRGLPEGGGFVALFDAETGAVTAVLEDEHHLSDLRTAAAGAVCARALSRPDATRATVLGTGRQAELQARALTLVRPVRQLSVWGRDHRRAAALADRLGRDLPHVDVTAAVDPERAVRRCDIVVTATAGPVPVLFGSWLRPGRHITALGADDPAKRELGGACLRRATQVFVDSRELALRHGDIHAAVARGEVTADRIDGEIGDVLAGRIPGRRTPDDVTVAKLIGIGPQDLAAAETALALLAGSGG